MSHEDKSTRGEVKRILAEVSRALDSENHFLAALSAEDAYTIGGDHEGALAAYEEAFSQAFDKGRGTPSAGIKTATPKP